MAAVSVAASSRSVRVSVRIWVSVRVPLPEYYPPEYYPSEYYRDFALFRLGTTARVPYGRAGRAGAEREATPEDARRADYGLVSLHACRTAPPWISTAGFWLTAEALEQRWLRCRVAFHTLTVNVSGARPIERRIQVKAGANAGPPLREDRRLNPGRTSTDSMLPRGPQ